MSNNKKNRQQLKNQENLETIEETKKEVIEVIEEKYPNTIRNAKNFNYTYWLNKPVTKFDEIVSSSEIIDQNLINKKVYSEELKLPISMKWNEINLTDNNSLLSVVNFLNKYYLIDNDFKPLYTPEYIKWTLGENGILLSIVNKNTNALCGIICSKIVSLTVYDKNDLFGNIILLCSHPTYRKKKIAQVLIDEMTRRLLNKNIKHAYFTTERCVPTPVSILRSYHRPINYVKLQKNGFLDFGGDPLKVHEKFILKNEIPKNYIIMEESHLEEVVKLYSLYMTKFNICCNYTKNELKTLLLNNKFVRSYVILDKNNKINDFVSYYELPYFNDKNNSENINAGYLFLHTCNIVPIDEIINNMILLMEQNSIDIFNIDDVVDIRNGLLTEDVEYEDDSDKETYERVYECKFTKTKSKTYVNFFNWKCPTTKSKQIGFI